MLGKPQLLTRSALMLAVLSIQLLIAAPAQAQTETVLYTFQDSPDGSASQSSLTFHGGSFYGTTSNGGPYGYGTVFKLSPNGNGGWDETVLYSFTGRADGAFPERSNVIFDSLGNLYGTTGFGGDLTCGMGCGVVFELSRGESGWTETVLHSFANGADGALPVGGLIMDPAGNLYGNTCCGNVGGTVFELSRSGDVWTEQVIYSGFAGGVSGLTMDPAGNIFGTGASTVFELSPNGNSGWNPAVIYTFPRDRGLGTLALDPLGNLYGTTAPANGPGTVSELSLGKTGTWKKKNLHVFKGVKAGDGNKPLAGIVLDADGNLYGSTLYGGIYDQDIRLGEGTVFELLAPTGGHGSYTEKILWSFDETDGALPAGGLILDSAGNLYGTTSQGGVGGITGVVFEVTPTSCASPTTIGNYTSCGTAFNVNDATGNTVSVNYTPTAGNGVEIFATYCTEFSPILCGSFNHSITAKISDNINSPETCFTLSPNSPYYSGNTSVPDDITEYAWYCPAIPSGVTGFTLSTSDTGSNTTFLTLAMVEWKAGSVAASNYFENVDAAGSSNNVPSLSASMPTNGSTTHTNDLITGLIALCGGSLTISPGSVDTGLIVNPSTNPGVLIEAQGVTSAGTQSLAATWSGSTPCCNCPLGLSGGLTTWYGMIVPLVGASQPGATIGLPSVSGRAVIGYLGPSDIPALPTKWVDGHEATCQPTSSCYNVANGKSSALTVP